MANDTQIHLDWLVNGIPVPKDQSKYSTSTAGCRTTLTINDIFKDVFIQIAVVWETDTQGIKLDWFINDEKVLPSSYKYKTGTNGDKRTLTIRDIVQELSLEITAVVKVVEQGVFLKKLMDCQYLEGNDVVFLCEMVDDNIQLDWLIDGMPLPTDAYKYRTTSNGRERKLTIMDIHPEDSAKFIAERESGNADITDATLEVEAVLRSDNTDIKKTVAKLTVKGCKACLTKRDELKNEHDIIVMCIQKNISSSEEKGDFIQKVLRYVCALRNSGSGKLYIHFRECDTECRYHGWLDEAIDRKLMNMVEDGTPFTETYLKTWEPDDKKSGHHLGFLCIDVAGAASVSTVNFNTKLATDYGLEMPSSLTISSILENGKVLKIKIPGPGGGTVHKLYESRNIQFKSAEEQTKNQKGNVNVSGKNKLDSLFDKLMNKDKFDLRGYISAFTKQKNGGYFYLGIDEKREKNKVKIRATGFSLSELDDVGGDFEMFNEIPENRYNARMTTFVKMIDDYLDEHLSIYKYDRDKDERRPSKLLYKTRFYVALKGRIFMEIAVSAYPGLVFTSKGGPESYIWQNGKIVKLNYSEWFDLLKRSFSSQGSTDS